MRITKKMVKELFLRGEIKQIEFRSAIITVDLELDKTFSFNSKLRTDGLIYDIDTYPLINTMTLYLNRSWFKC